MKIKLLLSIGSFLLIFSMVAPVHAQEVKVIKKADLQTLLDKKNGKLRVINFWATWCRPCVKELPHFDALKNHFPGQPIEVILVSLDFKNQLESKVKPFVQKQALQSSVLLLDETDYDTWLGVVDENWQGDIPATVIVYPEKNVREFKAKELSEEALHTWLKKYLP